MRPFMSLLALSYFACASDAPKGAIVAPKPSLWAAIAVNRLVLGKDETLVVSFAVINDTASAIDPELGKTLLLANGKPLKDWDMIVGQGPMDARFTSLPSGDH